MERFPEVVIGFVGSGLSLVHSFFSWGFPVEGAWLFIVGTVSLGALISVALGRYKRVSSIVLLACGAITLIILNSIISGLLLVVAGIMLLIRKENGETEDDIKKK